MNMKLEQSFTYYRGRVALKAILDGLDIGAGDEVITQAFTCVAVPEAIIASGAKPIYVDIKENSFNMCPSDLKTKISEKTKAIVVQHTYGIPADMDEIIRITDKANIPIIEDCCHTFSSKYKGKKVGTFGVASFYSFEWGKPLVLGVGGSTYVNNNNLRKIMKNNYSSYKKPSFLKIFKIRAQYIVHKIFYRPSLYWKLKSLFHLLSSLKITEGNYYSQSEEHKIPSDYNLKMSKYHQKLLKKKADVINLFAKKSNNVVSKYSDRIENDYLKIWLNRNSINEMVLIRYPLITNNKDILLTKAKKQKIEISDWYRTPIHPLTEKEWGFVYYNKGTCPNAELMCKKVITLPIKRVKDKDIKKIIGFINKNS